MIEHRYGANVRLIGGPASMTWLARLCAPETFQPQINSLVERLYTNLVERAIDSEFPRATATVPTRMTEAHPSCPFEGEIVDPSARAVVVNLARAGTFPSHVCFEALCEILDPRRVRQDHILASRLVDAGERVTGASFAGAKIGGDVHDSTVIFPDPMGATGNTIVQALDHYKSLAGGKARRYCALHLIVTPEYLKRVQAAHPDAVIFAVRVDRGLSDPRALAVTPGEHWDLERDLDDRHYIVPGGGGFGEIMNNSFV